MEKLQELINIIREDLAIADELIQEAKFKKNTFIRKGKISNDLLLLSILTNSTGALSEQLLDVYEQMGLSDEAIPTKQALSQKRKLIDESPFYKIYQDLLAHVYNPQNLKKLKTYNGLIPIGVDGSDIAIPNNPVLKEIFGTAGRGGTSVTARGSVAFDLLNKNPLDALLTPMEEGERKLMLEHLGRLGSRIPPELAFYIMDRGYFSAELFKEIDEAGSFFLVRCPIGTCHAVDDALTDDFVTLNNGMVVKVIKIKLDSGQIEVLVTNRFDLDEYDAYELYHLRWEIEENFKIIKCHLHLECFSGCSETVVRQEFYAVIINNLLLSALAQQVDEQIEQKEDNKYNYKANRNRCSQILRRKLVTLLITTEEDKLQEIYGKIIRHALKDKTPVRPGRSNPRKTKRAVRYHLNQRYN